MKFTVCVKPTGKGGYPYNEIIMIFLFFGSNILGYMLLTNATPQTPNYHHLLQDVLKIFYFLLLKSLFFWVFFNPSFSVSWNQYGYQLIRQRVTTKSQEIWVSFCISKDNKSVCMCLNVNKKNDIYTDGQFQKCQKARFKLVQMNCSLSREDSYIWMIES